MLSNKREVDKIIDNEKSFEQNLILIKADN